VKKGKTVSFIVKFALYMQYVAVNFYFCLATVRALVKKVLLAPFTLRVKFGENFRTNKIF
jgi:hypothetical protein